MSEKRGVKRTIKKNVEADRIPMNDAFEEYLEEKVAHNLAQPSIKSYKATYCRFKEFVGNDSYCDEITQQHIYKWIGIMKQDDIKHTSINHYLTEIRAFLYWCMNEDREYIKPSFKIVLQKGQEEPPKTFSEEEQERLTDKPSRKASFAEWRTYTIVHWVLATGHRASTICNVKIGDLNFKKSEIMVRHTKNKSIQITPLSSSLASVLKEYIRMWRKNAKESDYLFCNVGEERLTTNALRHSFGRYCAERGVSKTSIHGLRHTFAKGWIRNNGGVFELQDLLGHKTLDMTRKYVKIYKGDVKRDYDSFSPLDNLKKSKKRKKTVEKTDFT